MALPSDAPVDAVETAPSASDESLARPHVGPGVTWTLIIAGTVGAVAAGALLVEKLLMATDSTYSPSCSINPILSCGSVMTSWQAEVFGVPNPLIGLAAFPVLLTTGVAVLAGARLRWWYWTGLLVGTLAGAVFIHWLAWQSLYDIGALCPYCLVVWVVTMSALVAVAAVFARHGRLPRFIGSYAPTLVVAWVVLIALLALVRFRAEWAALL